MDYFAGLDISMDETQSLRRLNTAKCMLRSS
jgi:hypothetical protein